MGFQFTSSWEAVVLGRFHDSWRCPRRLKIALRRKNGKGVFYGSRRHDPNDLPSKVLEDLSKAFDMGKVERLNEVKVRIFSRSMETAKSLLCWDNDTGTGFQSGWFRDQKLGSNLLQTALLMVLLPWLQFFFEDIYIYNIHIFISIVFRHPSRSHFPLLGGLHLAQFGRLRIPRMCDALGSVRGKFTGRGKKQPMEVEARKQQCGFVSH